MSNVVQFPNQQPDESFGAINTKIMNIKCLDCNNTERFYGRAMTQPFLVIQKQVESRYDITEIGYRNNGSINELVETCAECGSKNIEVNVLKKDVKG